MKKLNREDVSARTFSSFITLDELIESLQEAKEHCISGNTTVKITISDIIDGPMFVDVIYDNSNVELVID